MYALPNLFYAYVCVFRTYARPLQHLNSTNLTPTHPDWQYHPPPKPAKAPASLTAKLAKLARPAKNSKNLEKIIFFQKFLKVYEGRN